MNRFYALDVRIETFNGRVRVLPWETSAKSIAEAVDDTLTGMVGLHGRDPEIQSIRVVMCREMAE